MSTLGLPAGKAGLPKGLRKHVRTEKARIRREFFDLKKQEELIAELYKKVLAGRQKMNPVRNFQQSSTALTGSNNHDKS